MPNKERKEKVAARGAYLQSGKRARGAYFAIYDLQGGPISPKLQEELESAILEVVKQHPSLAITVSVE
jgi:hypothetical protein